MGDGNFGWWFSIGGGERFEGPFSTREAAIEEGKSHHHDDGPTSFDICEADKAVPSFSVDADRVIEQFNEHNEECGDPDGDPLLECTSEQEQELGRELTAAFEAWAKRHGLPKHVWQFGTQRNLEVIAVEAPVAAGKVIGAVLPMPARALAAAVEAARCPLCSADPQRLTGEELVP